MNCLPTDTSCSITLKPVAWSTTTLVCDGITTAILGAWSCVTWVNGPRAVCSYIFFNKSEKKEKKNNYKSFLNQEREMPLCGSKNSLKYLKTFISLNFVHTNFPENKNILSKFCEHFLKSSISSKYV